MRDDGGFTWGESSISDEELMRRTNLVIAEHHAKTGGKCSDMDLRDYFAGQALTALIGKYSDWDTAMEVEAAYNYADFMLAERRKK